MNFYIFSYSILWILNHNTLIKGTDIIVLIIEKKNLTGNYVNILESKIKPLSLWSHRILPLNVTENPMKWLWWEL